MESYAGIDVSLESSSICVVDATGRIVREAKVASEPEALTAWCRSLAFDIARIGLEADPLVRHRDSQYRDCLRSGGQAAIAAGGCVSLAGWNLSSTGTERAIVDRAANLEQEIGTSSRPPHLLRFVHPAVHQKIGRPLGDRGTHSQSDTVPLGIIYHPIALAGEKSIQCEPIASAVS